MKLLVTGTGNLGSRVIALAKAQGHHVIAWSHTEPVTIGGVTSVPVDLTDNFAIADEFLRARPMVVIHTAAVSSIAGCQAEPKVAEKVNVSATRQLAELCSQTVSRMIFVSTDLVFDGKAAPYMESDLPTPLSRYGKTKRSAEKIVETYPGHLIARCSLLFGKGREGKPNFFDQQLADLAAGKKITLFEDEWRTPLGLGKAAELLLDLADAPVQGVLHLSGPERVSRVELGQRMCKVLGLKPEKLIDAQPRKDAGRPEDVSLRTEALAKLLKKPMPSLDAMLKSELK